MTASELLFAKCAAIAGAGFFLWKVVAGWLVVNLNISIEVERQAETAVTDLLAFKILFTKGSTDTLQIKDIQARVHLGDNATTPVQVFTFNEVNRLGVNDNNIVQWDKADPDGKNISLSPGESFHLGRFARVPKDVPVIVEVVLHGTRVLWIKGFQWRASVASLPVKKDVTNL